jgi:hypothetical protein
MKKCLEKWNQERTLDNMYSLLKINVNILSSLEEGYQARRSCLDCLHRMHAYEFELSKFILLPRIPERRRSHISLVYNGQANLIE